MVALEERFSSALHGAARAWRLAVDRRLKDLGLSQAGWLTIAVAAKARAPLSQSGLARSVGVEDATMVSMIDRLGKAGFVVREPSSTDRRVKRVVVTPAGMQLYDKVRTEAATVRKQLLAGIDAKQLVIATELLERVIAVIDATP